MGCSARSQLCCRARKKGGGHLCNPSLDLLSAREFRSSWQSAQLSSGLCHFLIYRNQHPEKLNDCLRSWAERTRTKSQVSWLPHQHPLPYVVLLVSSLDVNNQERVSTEKAGGAVRKDITSSELPFQLFCAQNKVSFQNQFLIPFLSQGFQVLKTSSDSSEHWSCVALLRAHWNPWS